MSNSQPQSLFGQDAGPSGVSGSSGSGNQNPQLKRKAGIPPLMSSDELEAAKQGRVVIETSTTEISKNNRKIYIGGLPPTVTEKSLVAHFRAFGHVVDCCVVRDKETGISRGFAFLTFVDDDEASAATAFETHKLDGKQIKVSFASSNPGNQQGSGMKSNRKRINDTNIMDSVTLPANQTRIYLGPLEDDVTNADLTAQLIQFGQIMGVSRLKASDTSVKRSYGFVEFKAPISVKRAFVNKIFIKGKHVKITLSKLAMELVLSRTVLFFYEAHLPIDRRHLDQHFTQFGQVFRSFQFTNDDFTENRIYGFVDFIGEDSVPRAMQQKQQFIHPGQYVRVGRMLPHHLTYDLMSISDKLGGQIVRKIELSVPEEGLWGGQSYKANQEQKTSQVRIPAKLVPKLIGERGKTITEICRDSKTKINIPKVRDDEPNVVVTITGLKQDITTAQYIMQKLLKGQK